jgi:hypothetical protein
MIKTENVLSVNSNLNIKNGYIMNGPTTQSLNNKSNINGANISVGSVYQKGNLSRSMYNLSNLGTLIGSLTLDDNLTNQQKSIIYNYLTCLLPGFYPKISGPWSENDNLYDLQTIIDDSNIEGNYYCKILGMGVGNIVNMNVASVNQNGIQVPSYLPFFEGINGFEIFDPADVSVFNQFSILNWSNINIETTIDVSTITINPYFSNFNWPNEFDVYFFNGSNSFPFMGWGGSRVGNISPVNFQKTRDSLYDFPITDLIQANNYDSLGIIYAGQGVQYTSIFIDNLKSTDVLSQNIFKKDKKEYSKRDKISTTNIIPYQQGIGSFDIFINSVNYNSINGTINQSSSLTEINPEGVQPGRNCAFLGVALTDYYSDNLDFKNIEKSSRTAQNTRAKGNLQQTQTAHNAPLSYNNNDNNDTNTTNPLPWNTLFGYVGDTTNSSNNKHSENTPILQEGITTMVITGAYPLYAGQWNSTVNPDNINFIGFGYGMDQYYYTTEFWNPTYLDSSIPQIQIANTEQVVQPNPPYRIKGGRIILFKGQRVKAGSYVYSSIQMTNNVVVPQFYPPSAKEIKLSNSEQNTLIGDPYSKFQGNQGGVIIIISEDGKEPPMIPSSAQPIGIVLEEIIGFGSPEQFEGMDKYGFQTINNLAQQKCYDPEKVCQLQGREVLVKLLPMYAQYYTSGVNNVRDSNGENNYPQHTPISWYNDSATKYETFYPIVSRVRTHYPLFTGIYTGELQFDEQNWYSNELTLQFSGPVINRNFDTNPEKISGLC